jgi:hypothetical protein
MNPPPSNTALSSKQLAILHYLYRFRFSTSQLLATTLHKHSETIRERLTTLLAEEYIGRRYKSEYHLLGKPAVYYLLPKGIKALRSLTGDSYSPQVCRNISHDKNASDEFIAHCLAVFDIYVQLHTRYGSDLLFYAKADLYDYNDFPDPRPDGYFRFGAGEEEQQYFLEILDTTKHMNIKKNRIKDYVKYARIGDWKENTATELPHTILVCQSPGQVWKIRKFADMCVENAYQEGLAVKVTTVDKVLAVIDPKKKARELQSPEPS